MSRKTNLITLRKNKLFLNNTLNFNSRLFLLNLNVIKSLKQLLLRKRVLLINETTSVSGNKLFFSCKLFFETNKLKLYKKKTVSNCIKSSLVNKNNLLFTLLQSIVKPFKVNSIITNIQILNGCLNKKLTYSLFKQLKKNTVKLFERRYSLFIDFIKILSLFIKKKIDISTVMYKISEIFKHLQKRTHSKFFIFIQQVFDILLLNRIVGIKFCIHGRLKGKPKASSLIIKKGTISIQTLNKQVEYTDCYTFTPKYGVFGFKLWINRN